MPKPRIVEPPEELEIGKPRVIAASKSERRIKIPEKIFIHLYTDRPHSNLRLNEVSDYLQKVLGKRAVIDVRGDFVKHHYGDSVPEEFLKNLAQAKAWAATVNARVWPPAHAPITENEKLEEEMRILRDDKTPVPEHYKDLMVSDYEYYEGAKLHNAFANGLRKDEMGHAHVVFTSRGIRTMGSDKRLHNRSGFSAGVMNLVSTTGVVEGPTQPIEYLQEMQNALNSGIFSVDGKHFVHSDDFHKALREKHMDKMLLPNDERLSEVMKGYALQAVKAHLTGHAFCADQNCRLFDAHQQEHVIQAQIKSGKLCQKHDNFFKQIREGKREVML